MTKIIRRFFYDPMRENCCDESGAFISLEGLDDRQGFGERLMTL